MKNKYLINLILTIATFMAMLILPQKAFADGLGGDVNEAGASATPSSRAVQPDTRVERLETYLASHNSPLAPYANVFVEKADAYDLDWRLVASISGVESTFGKYLPSNSFNAYGWNGGKFYFKSWEDGIETVSRSLATNYVARGADTVLEIGSIYAPPSTTWASKVSYFMEKIEEGPKTKEVTLALRLTI